MLNFFWQKLLHCVYVVILSVELTGLSDIYRWAGIFWTHESQTVLFVYLHFLLAITLVYVLLLALEKHSKFLSFFLLLFLKLLFFPQNLFVKIFIGKNVLDVVRGKVVFEEVIIYCCTHKDHSNFGIETNQSFDSKKYEVCIDISFMNFIQNYERKLFKKSFRIVNHSLKKYAIRHKKYFAVRFWLRGHSYLISYHIRSSNLVWQNLVEVDSCQSSRLNT